MTFVVSIRHLNRVIYIFHPCLYVGFADPQFAMQVPSKVVVILNFCDRHINIVERVTIKIQRQKSELEGILNIKNMRNKPAKYIVLPAKPGA